MTRRYPDNTQGSVLLSAASVASRASLQSVNTNNNSIRSLLTINKDIVKRLMKPGMPKEELEQRVEAYFAVQLQKAKDKKECAKETFIHELIQEDEKQQSDLQNLKQDTSLKMPNKQQQKDQKAETISGIDFSRTKLQLDGCMGLECKVVQSRCVAGIGREMRKLQKCEEVYRSKRMSSWEYLLSHI
jgi:hypothetical protein